jgi:hypothetical protein
MTRLVSQCDGKLAATPAVKNGVAIPSSFEVRIPISVQ